MRALITGSSGLIGLSPCKNIWQERVTDDLSVLIMGWGKQKGIIFARETAVPPTIVHKKSESSLLLFIFLILLSMLHWAKQTYSAILDCWTLLRHI